MSHDRRFLDNVVTQTLAAEGDGVWREYVGGYSDWLEQRPKPAVQSRAQHGGRARAGASATKPRAKLSFKEQRELAALPGRDRERWSASRRSSTRA